MWNGEWMDGNHFAHQILVREAKPWWLVVCIVAALADNLLNNGVCRTLAFPFTLKSKYLKAKEELWKIKHIFHHAKNIIFKASSDRNQNPSRYHNSITNLKFQHKPKTSSFKNPHIKIDLLLLPRGQIPLSYYTLSWIHLYIPRYGTNFLGCRAISRWNSNST